VKSTRSRRAGWISLAASAAVVSALTAAPAVADDPNGSPQAQKAPTQAHQSTTGWRAKLPSGALDRATGQAAWFVQFKGTGAADASRRSGPIAAVNAKANAERLSGSVLSSAKAKDTKSTRLYTVSNALPGMGIRADATAIKAIAKRSDVLRVSRIVPKKITNASTAQLTRALDNWHYTNGVGYGVRIGIIDTGLDYTHADFGGPGTPAAYDAALAKETSPDWRSGLSPDGKFKVVDGYDFAGNTYDADPASDNYQPVPHPDSNPIDCNEHGTHVAGTAAGYGVGADGKQFTGDYKKLTGSSLYKMKVGPGMAPRAKLYAFKVFGCEGSTDLVIPALDRALDPNQDGNFSDHLDMINMSLGSDYGSVDDPENAIVNELADNGVLSIISMGNNGDLTDTGGAPGNAESSLAAASSVDEYQLRDGLKVNAPAGVAGISAGQFSVAYDWQNNGPTHAPVTGDVVAIPGANADGCDAFSTSDKAKVAGKVVWLIWDDDDTTRRCGSAARANNAHAAGAIGSIFTSQLNVFGAGITGSADIPVIQLPKSQTDKLQPAVNAGTLNVTFDGKYQATVQDRTPAITDTISSFTSRGPHGSQGGVVKPDVTAPGDTIASAGMGTGNGTLVISGTSMAAPNITGASALVKALHPSYTPGQIKAAVMNTAGSDLWSGESRSGHRYGPARVGAGRVDARRATTTRVLAYVKGDHNPVSASFGAVQAPVDQATVKETRTVTLQNFNSAKKTATLKYDAVVSQPGVSYSVSPTSVTIPARGTKDVTVTMTVTPKALRHSIDPTMAKQQLGEARQYLSDASGHLLVTPYGAPALRVPVYGAAKPVTTTKATAGQGQIDLAGQGVDQGSGSTAFRSFTSVLTLGARSGQLPACSAVVTSGCVDGPTSRSGDLKYVGAGANDDYLWFGISTYGEWANVGNALIPYVDYDVNANGKPDFETFLTNLPATDVLVAETVRLRDDTVVDIEPINFNVGDVDTNVFDSNVALLPVWKAAVKLPRNGTSRTISYTVGMFNGFTGADIDTAEVPSFDAGDPPLRTAGELFLDQGDTSIDYTAASAVEALVIHLHGATTKRAEVVDLPASPGAGG
jgi:subtilisin family serine protease